MADETVNVAETLAAIALSQAAGSGKTQVTKEDIILKCAEFVNSGEGFVDHVETMWAKPPKSLNPNTKRIREVIESVEAFDKYMLVGHTPKFGIFLTKRPEKVEKVETK